MGHLGDSNRRLCWMTYAVSFTALALKERGVEVAMLTSYNVIAFPFAAGVFYPSSSPPASKSMAMGTFQIEAFRTGALRART